MGGVKRYGRLRFGLLGPPVLYDGRPGEGRTAFGAAAHGAAAHGAPTVGAAADDSEAWNRAFGPAAGAHGGSASDDPGGTATVGLGGSETGGPETGGFGGPETGGFDGFETGGLGGSAVDGRAGAAVPRVRVIGSPKLRVLLAALLLGAGRTVTVDVLEEALWGGTPPPSARASLHNHVARLRRLLDAPGRLRTVPSGYVLRVGEGEVDVHLFEAEVAVARAAHADRAWERVLRSAAAALALWRGTPLAGLPAEVGGYAFAQRLEEARLLLLEWRYDAVLALGGGLLDDAVPELAALVAEHPLREAYQRQLMLALHRTGRQTEALAVHRDLRARLVEELGAEPGPAVREAHLEVLRGAVTRRGPEDGGSPGGMRPTGGKPRAGRAPRPAQLPPAPAHFTGRADVLDDLLRALAPGTRPAVAAVAVTVISGMAGAGKSALALRAAHELRRRFPDGQLYLDLRGATPGKAPLTTGQALAALLRHLGAEPRDLSGRPDAAAASLRSLLAPTRTLLVLDNAANAAQVRPLLPAGPGCAVIVTSRSPLTALDGVHHVPLGLMSREESAALLRAASGRDGGLAPDDPGALTAGHPLVELAGRLPLALRVVAARLAARPALPPEVLAGQLAAAERPLDHLEYDDLNVRASLAVTHDALTASGREPDRDAVLVLRRIGDHPLPAYGAALLARLTGIGERRTEAALDRLVDVALLEETAYGHYAPHDLVRLFARELAGGRAAGAGPTRDGDDDGAQAPAGAAAVPGADATPAPEPTRVRPTTLRRNPHA